MVNMSAKRLRMLAPSRQAASSTDQSGLGCGLVFGVWGLGVDCLRAQQLEAVARPHTRTLIIYQLGFNKKTTTIKIVLCSELL